MVKKYEHYMHDGLKMTCTLLQVTQTSETIQRCLLGIESFPLSQLQKLKDEHLKPKCPKQPQPQ